jgi:hypothetical protein
MIFAPFDFVFLVNTQHRTKLVPGSQQNYQDPVNLVLMRIGVDAIK